MTSEQHNIYLEIKNKFETIEAIANKALKELNSMWSDGYIDSDHMETYIKLVRNEVAPVKLNANENPFTDLGKAFNVK